MKTRNFLKKAAAIVLVSSMVMTIPGTAATAQPDASTPFAISSLWSGLTDLFKNLTDRDSSADKQDAMAADSAVDSTASDDTQVQSMAVDAGTASNEEEQVSAYAADSLAYFPVTFFNYDKEDINAHILQEEATALAAAGTTTVGYWKGLYFSGGSPSASDGIPLSTTVASGESQTVYQPVTVAYDEFGDYSEYENGEYFWDESGRYMIVDISCVREEHWWWGVYYTYNWSIGYNDNGSEGTTSSANSTITLYRRTVIDGTSITAGGYAGYDYWTGNEAAGYNPDNGITGNATRGYIYSGLVEDELDSNGNIQFTVPDGGIFDTADTSSKKDVYTNVRLPFEFDSDSGMYTFDSDTMAAYFEGTPASGATLAYSDTPAAFYYNTASSAEHPYHTGFFPFNELSNREKSNVETSSGSVTRANLIAGNDSNGNEITSGDNGADFWFGMSANISFTMNSNGKMTGEENSDPVVFTFSGDDDVWVFIDGQLVLDLGGIHDSVTGTINFAENTITMNSTNQSFASGDVADKYESGSGLISQGSIFNEVNEDGELIEGKLNTDINTFSATSEHTLTIYYLERGGGLSNNKIQFNLPQRDSVSVSKIVSNVDSNGDPLSESQQNAVNNYNFEFILRGPNGEAAADQGYSLYSSVGTFLGNGTTDQNGHFSIRNGQTARFYGLSLDSESVYYVEEALPEGNPYTVPAWSYLVTGGTGEEVDSSLGNVSHKVKVNGSQNSSETIEFTCRNTLMHVENASVSPSDDMIVVDYGLPVEIDVLANDIWTGDEIKLTLSSDNDLQFGTAEIRDNKIVYTLNKQMTDVETLKYDVVAKDGSAVATGSASVKIIPATSMYYEEDFGFVTFTNGKSSGWEEVGHSLLDYQETGVVGVSSNSPYGSDPAYLDNQSDSYGTSMHVDTTSGAAQFSYTFTGTGTTVFARMTQSTGYLRIHLEREDKSFSETTYRDIKILNPEDGSGIQTLYNVPIYDYQTLDYGTYTLTITVAKAGTITGTEGGAGKDFYLDGIRVYTPMNPNSKEYSTAETAYLRDNESNVLTAQVRAKILDEYAVDGEGGLEWNLPEGTQGKFVTFTDTDGTLQTAEEYSSIGPKNEVYLMNGQSIMFSLTDWDSDSGRVYLGLKAPAGAGTGTVQIGSTVQTINNTVDCYYDISNMGTIREIDGKEVITFDITAGSGSLISVTNIKVTGNASFVIIPGEEVSGDVGGDLDNAADTFENGTPAYQVSKNSITNSLNTSVEIEEQNEPVQQESVEAVKETEAALLPGETDVEESTSESETTGMVMDSEQPETEDSTSESQPVEQKGDMES